MLTDRAEQTIRIADRSGGRVAVCYLDIDKFKSVNDNWGHMAGDELLIEIAVRLQKKILREEDSPARIYGDEFIVLLPEVAGQGSLDLVTLTRNRQTVAHLLIWKPFLFLSLDSYLTCFECVGYVASP